jgi:hypothetical protein
MIKLLASFMLTLATWLQFVPTVPSNSGAGGGGACTATVSVEGVGSENNASGTNLSVTAAGPTTTDANTLVVAFIDFDGSGASVSGCTFAGTSMVSAGTAAHNSTSNLNASMWYLLNPSTGNQTLACTGTSVSEYYYNTMSFHNVNASTPVRAGSYQTTNSGLSLTISSNSQDFSVTVLENNGGITSSNQTDTHNNGGSFSGGSDHATTPAASVTHTWTASGGNSALAGMSVRCK